MRVFVGRTDLLELIDRLVEVPVSGDIDRSRRADGVRRPDPVDKPRPVLLVEGCGGSGRTALLTKALDRWQGRTPAVLVRPLEQAGDQDNPLRPALTAVMLGLSLGVPGFRVSFPRVIIAQIAIKEDFSPLTADEKLPRLRTLLNQYQNRATLIRFIRDLVVLAGAQAANIQLPGAAVIAPAVANAIADTLATRMLRGRWMTRINWGTKVDWFGHQDLGLPGDPELALINLSGHARSRDPGVRRDVDDLLIGALLADLRDSARRVRGRPSNVLVLLDDGDAPIAQSFTGSLLRARRSIVAAGGDQVSDPLTVVTTGSGALVDDLAGPVPAPVVWADPRQIDAITVPWARVRLADLSDTEVKLLAKKVDPFESEAIGDNVFRLTKGHAAATAYLFDKIGDTPSRHLGLDDLLREPGPESGITVERHLLRIFARGLSAHKRIDEDLVKAMITVAAARNLREAKGLEELLPPGVSLDSPLFTNRSLWLPAAADDGRRAMPPLARYLGLRSLAARTEPGVGWEQVFGKLRAAVDTDDRQGRMHYDRLLSGRAAVVGELAELLPELPAAQWLALFDEIVSTPDPRRQDSEVLDGPDRANTRQEHISVLLAVISALELDLRITTPEQKAKLCWRAALGYDQLATETSHSELFSARASKYRTLAQRFQ